MSDRDTRSRGLAYHEAGHAVAHAVERWARDPRSVTIVANPKEHTLGHVQLGPLRLSALKAPRMERIVAEIVCAFAGGVAEKRATGRYNNRAARCDQESAVDLVQTHLECSSEKQANAAVKWLWTRSEDLVETYWHVIESVAQALLERKTLSAAELAQIISLAWAPP